jgi:hypothetical protein
MSVGFSMAVNIPANLFQPLTGSADSPTEFSAGGVFMKKEVTIDVDCRKETSDYQ